MRQNVKWCDCVAVLQVRTELQSVINLKPNDSIPFRRRLKNCGDSVTLGQTFLPIQKICAESNPNPAL